MSKSIAERFRSVLPESATTVPEEPDGGATDDGSDANPNAGLNAADQKIAMQATMAERALQQLYLGAGDDPTMQQMAITHDAYAARIAGIAGISSKQADETVTGEYPTGFSSDPTDALDAENGSAARLAAWAAEASDSRLVAALTSIAIGTSRQAALIGFGLDLDSALQNDKMNAESTEASS